MDGKITEWFHTRHRTLPVGYKKELSGAITVYEIRSKMNKNVGFAPAFTVK